jgi:excisionase family DNA binding protein
MAKRATPEQLAEIRTRSVLNHEEVGLVLGLSKNMVYQQIGNGTIPSIKCGRRRVVPAAAVFEMVGIRSPKD